MMIDDFDFKFVLDETAIKDFFITNSDDGEIAVGIELDKNGANKFYESMLGKRQIIILLEGRVISAPIVNPENPIKDGKMIILGEFA